MAKRKGQTIIYKTLHTQLLTNEQHKPHKEGEIELGLMVKRKHLYLFHS
jgi:hypothetical protein